MENIIKRVIEIENSAKTRLNEIKEIQQKNIEDCRVEFKLIKREKYKNINDKIDAYKNEQNNILDLKIKSIVNNQEKINSEFIDDFNANFDSILQNLYDKIIR